MKKTIVALLVIALIAGASLYLYSLNKGKPEGAGTTASAPPNQWSTADPNGQMPPDPDLPPSETDFQENFIRETWTDDTTSEARSAAATEAPPAVYAFAGVYPGINPVVAKVPADPALIYVNRNNALPNGYSGNVLTAVCVKAYPNQRMETLAAQQYGKMYLDALKAGITLVPYSGYRSTNHQKVNFENKIAQFQQQGESRSKAVISASNSILPPGCSEHEAGLAMDIAVPGHLTTDPDFDQTDAFDWLSNHAHEYGFILRYPADRVETTLVKYEPWHWRYVGATHAAAMREAGQCLEDYLNKTA
ncbi:MAG: M15 family metallopeptidase [Oscillospiraceae bacterium]|jgi:D-alanyl-D-alanine carboxypeptidase|nr:M15 family metallopeptidase [Oscillospiraceae bacterium]